MLTALGKKKEYEDYIDLSYILERLYMDPEIYLNGIKEVTPIWLPKMEIFANFPKSVFPLVFLQKQALKPFDHGQIVHR